ncbi:DUF421 domain-containing protein [Pseudonocardia sp. CA-107938]|uniref:DUF421 domain-containing protein n=1 Tax=Pseudonocardia sp. CA-107938 TaxID=3240021 RepID=UPI003D912C82
MLFTMQRMYGMLLRHPRFAAVITPRPVLLMLDGRLDASALRRNRLTEDDLRQRLREAGVARRDDIHCVVLERNGCISVVRAASEVDSWITQDLTSARGVSRTPASTWGRPARDIRDVGVLGHRCRCRGVCAAYPSPE